MRAIVIIELEGAYTYRGIADAGDVVWDVEWSRLRYCWICELEVVGLRRTDDWERGKPSGNSPKGSSDARSGTGTARNRGIRSQDEWKDVRQFPKREL